MWNPKTSPMPALELPVDRVHAPFTIEAGAGGVFFHSLRAMELVVAPGPRPWYAGRSCLAAGAAEARDAGIAVPKSCRYWQDNIEFSSLLDPDALTTSMSP